MLFHRENPMAGSFDERIIPLSFNNPEIYKEVFCENRVIFRSFGENMTAHVIIHSLFPTVWISQISVEGTFFIPVTATKSDMAKYLESEHLKVLGINIGRLPSFLQKLQITQIVKIYEENKDVFAEKSANIIRLMDALTVHEVDDVLDDMVFDDVVPRLRI